MELKLIGDNGESDASVSAPDSLFGREYNEALVHQVVTAYLPTLAAPTAPKRDVRKLPNPPANRGGKKVQGVHVPVWRRARCGVVEEKFFPTVLKRILSHKVNRKMYRAGMGAILSQLVRENRLSVVENFALNTPKTKILAGKLKDMKLGEVMIVTDSVDENLYLSSRNLPLVKVVEAVTSTRSAFCVLPTC